MSEHPAADAFDDKLAEWRSWAETPWGRIRFAVVEETLRRQVVELGGGPLRVLDVGGGDGRDAVPLAAAGHHVTIVDPAERWLAEGRQRADDAGVAGRIDTVVGGLDDLSSLPTDFDLVLCHFVLHYRSPDPTDLTRLVSRVRPGGRLSVMAPNAAARVVMTLTREGPAAAREELTTLAGDTMVSHTFNSVSRRIAADDLAVDLQAAGLRVVHRYGTRIANDLLADDAAKQDPAYFAELLRLELELCDREPFLRLGGLWQVVAERVS